MPILSWLNKDGAVKAAQKVTYRLLEGVPELNHVEPEADSMLIQGNKLEVFKSGEPVWP